MKKLLLILFILPCLLFGKNGLVKTYYEDGQLQSEGNYINDIKEDSWKTYYKNGYLNEELNYKNGIEHGL